MTCNFSQSVLTIKDREEIHSWNLNALTTIAALGFGNIPPYAFIEALNLINKQGWVAFNIKKTFLYNTDHTGFSKLIRGLIFSEYLNINHLERYRHRLSIEGGPCIILVSFVGKIIMYLWNFCKNIVYSKVDISNITISFLI
jgi:hypothetical protein